MIDLKSLHTFGFSAKANTLKEINQLADIGELLPALNSEPYWILGEGSNSIFVEDFKGMICKVNLQGKEISQSDEQTEVRVAAGENWHQFVCWCLEHHLFGLENLALIPGTVGAAPIQNIGAYGREVKDYISKVEFIDIATGELIQLTADECHFGYRDSIFKAELFGKVIITSVTFVFKQECQPEQSYGELANLVSPTAMDIFNKVIEIRKSKLPDPIKIGNAGSFFKNPEIPATQWRALKEEWPQIPGYAVSESVTKVPAAWLIDQLGFKGKAEGGIVCHPNQPLVLANSGLGTGQQLLMMARDIQQSAFNRFGISLENEVRLIGAKGLISL